MSTLLNAPSSALTDFLPVTDDRLAVGAAANMSWVKLSSRQAQSTWLDGAMWSRSVGLGGQFSTYGMGNYDDAGTATTHWELWGSSVSWGQVVDDSGGCSQNFLVGFTQDQNGNPLGNCIVQGFVTANDVFVGQTTSDTSGWYKLPTPYSISTNHYIVAYKAGSPAVAGTTVNTLTPATTG